MFIQLYYGHYAKEETNYSFFVFVDPDNLFSQCKIIHFSLDWDILNKIQWKQSEMCKKKTKKL